MSSTSTEVPLGQTTLKSGENHGSVKSNVSFQFKKSRRLAATKGRRKRLQSEDDKDNDSSKSDSNEGESGVVHRSRVKRPNRMVQSTVKNSAGAQRTKRLQDSSESESDAETVKEAAPAEFFYTSKEGMAGPSDMGATATLEINTEHAQDAQATFERALAIQEAQKGQKDDEIYRGMQAYAKFTETKDSVAGKASSGMVRKGPIRAPDFLRQTVRWDYKPDLCKDYKETGFCTFGDSCIFMHDRTDYKHGWELEREWEQGTYGRDTGENWEVSSDEEEVPFKCFICRESFKDPIVTKCGHYFCEKCAIGHYQKTSKRCYVCGKQTLGVFNPAKNIIARLGSAEDAGEGKSGEGCGEKCASDSD